MSRTTFERFYRNPKAISMAIGATAFAVLGGLSSVSLSESFHESGGGLAPVASAPAAITSSTAPTKTGQADGDRRTLRETPTHAMWRLTQ